MANDLPTPPPKHLAPFVGTYTGRHDRCLYRLGYDGTTLTLCRCCTCGPCPDADIFSTPYPITEDQARRLLTFSLDPYYP